MPCCASPASVRSATSWSGRLLYGRLNGRNGCSRRPSSLADTSAAVAQWLVPLPSKQATRVRFPPAARFTFKPTLAIGLKSGADLNYGLPTATVSSGLRRSGGHRNLTWNLWFNSWRHVAMTGHRSRRISVAHVPMPDRDCRRKPVWSFRVRHRVRCAQVVDQTVGITNTQVVPSFCRGRWGESGRGSGQPPRISTR